VERSVHELRTEAPAPIGGGRALALGLGLCACALVAAFAAGGVGSRVGAPPTGGFAPIQLAADVVVGGLAVFGLFVLVMTRGAGRRARGRDQVPLWQRILAMCLVALVVLGAVSLISKVPSHPIRGGPSGGLPAKKPPPATRAKATHHGGALDAAWVPAAAVIVGVLLGIAVLYAIFRQPRHEPPAEPEQPLDRAIAAGIEGLETEADPRRAVIKAYAGMEHALAVDGLPREPSETPLEFLRRVFERLESSRGATARLTRLYEQAKFSTHPIDERMRGEALSALAQLRTELAG
jgi:hypothetical protein